MHIQPNSKKIRKEIPVKDFFLWTAQQAATSLIGFPLSMFSTSQLESRVIELEELEAKGFVYLGEKNWIRSYLSNNDTEIFKTYDTWIKHNFSNFLNITFTPQPQHFNASKTVTIWKAELDVVNLALNYKSLQHPYFYPLDDLEIYIAGNSSGPTSSFLFQAFACLHQLEYSLTTYPKSDKPSQPVSITGIEVVTKEKPSQWELNVISEYGSEWDMTFIGMQLLT